jgi:GntR family transcriptional regulator, histidine utilization repressor
MKLRKSRGGIPLYKQVKEYIVTRILAGDWPQGQRLPSENDITGMMGVSRMTAHRALRELTNEGWLTRVQGAGTFVAESKAQSALMEINNIREEISERGHTHSCEVILLAREKASADIAHALSVDAGTVVYHSVLVHKEDKRPVQVENRYINPAFAPNFLEQDFTRITAFEYLGKLGPLDAAEHIIEAVLPNAENRRLLRCRADEPCLLLTRRTWSNGLVVSRVRQMYPGSRYRLVGQQEYNQTTH